MIAPYLRPCIADALSPLAQGCAESIRERYSREMVDQMSPEMIKWSIWVPVAAFIAMQASMRQTGSMITGYTNEMKPMLFFGWWALLLVVGEILWQIFTNLEEILKLVWKMALDLCAIAAYLVGAWISFWAACMKLVWNMALDLQVWIIAAYLITCFVLLAFVLLLYP